MDTRDSYESLRELTAYDSSGEKIGGVTDIFYDDVTGRPEWVSVKAGTFKGTRLVPLVGARLEDYGDDPDDRHLVLAFDADRIKDAPDVDADEHLTTAEEQDLYRHYGYTWTQRDQDFGYGTSWSEDRFDRDWQSSPAVRPTSAAARLRRYMEADR